MYANYFAKLIQAVARGRAARQNPPPRDENPAAFNNSGYSECPSALSEEEETASTKQETPNPTALVSLALLPSLVSQALFLVGVHFHPCDSESYDL
jgi:hypothetical protein